jgi:hypothetical protein
MPYASRRSYAGASAACTLTSSINSSVTSLDLTGTVTEWPDTASGSFHMVIDPGLSTEEKILVGARSTGALSSITRGVDGTSAASHTAGATCYPVFTATDADQANKIVSTLTTKGDLLVTTGSVLDRLAAGANGTVLAADSAATNGVAWSAAYATLASPALTGTPTAPTAAVSTNTTQVATTAFVMASKEDDQFILAMSIFS